MPEIPSRHESQVQRKAVIAYVPIRLGPTVTNWMGYRHAAQHRIKAIICDQAGVATACPAGARVVGPCVHGTMALMAGTYYSQQAVQATFTSTHKRVNLVDPGSKLDPQFNVDIVLGNMG